MRSCPRASASICRSGCHPRPRVQSATSRSIRAQVAAHFASGSPESSRRWVRYLRRPKRSWSCFHSSRSWLPSDRWRSRSPHTGCSSVSLLRSGWSPSCSCTRSATSSSFGARESRHRRHFSSPSLGRSSQRSRWAKTPPQRRGWDSQARSWGASPPLFPLGIWLATGSDFWRALAYIGFFLNLFNLLPIVPLDGGRAMAALSPAVWLIGLAGLLTLTIFYPSPVLFLILILGAMESWRRWKTRATLESRAYYAIPTRTRALVGIVYVGLAAALSVGLAETYLSRGL